MTFFMMYVRFTCAPWAMLAPAIPGTCNRLSQAVTFPFSQPPSPHSLGFALAI